VIGPKKEKGIPTKKVKSPPIKQPILAILGVLDAMQRT
jgi:hypothetical protein